MSASKAKPPKADMPSDARLVRELMLRAGLDVQSAARELEINAKALLGYMDGRPVPRYVVLALMHLADVSAHRKR
jgi:hypothetical protein